MNKILSKNKVVKIMAFVVLLTIVIYASYIGYNRYSFLKNSLDMSFSNSILDLEYNCIENKKLAEDILATGKSDKSEVLLFEEREHSILNILGRFSNITNGYTKTTVDFVKCTDNFLLKGYGKNFLLCSNSRNNEIKVLTDDDKSYLRGKIIIYDIILNSKKGSTIDFKNGYIKNDMWLKWYTSLTKKIIDLNLEDITK